MWCWWREKNGVRGVRHWQISSTSPWVNHHRVIRFLAWRSGVPLLNGPTEFGPHHPTPKQFTTSPRKYAHPGDILFCVRGSTTGRMNWANQEYAIGRGIAAIRHRQESALQPFVRAVIECELVELLAQATGSTFPNVSGHLNLLRFRIPIWTSTNNAPSPTSSAPSTTRLN